MRYVVSTLPRAESDMQHIYDWIRIRSPEGAIRWWQAFENACNRLEQNPLSYALAPEAEWCGGEVRHILFKTGRGRYYRALYLVVDQVVRILRVRGPGEPDLSDDELR